MDWGSVAIENRTSVKNIRARTIVHRPNQDEGNLEGSAVWQSDLARTKNFMRKPFLILQR